MGSWILELELESWNSSWTLLKISVYGRWLWFSDSVYIYLHHFNRIIFTPKLFLFPVLSSTANQHQQPQQPAAAGKLTQLFDLNRKIMTRIG